MYINRHSFLLEQCQRNIFNAVLVDCFKREIKEYLLETIMLGSKSNLYQVVPATQVFQCALEGKKK